MSTRLDDPDDPEDMKDDDLRSYVDAYREVEAPTPQARARVVRALREQSRRTAHWRWIAVGAMAAAAALVLLLGGVRTWRSAGVAPEPVQSGYDHSQVPQEAQTLVRRPKKRASPEPPDPSEPPEPEPEAPDPAEASAVPDQPPPEAAPPRSRRPAPAAPEPDASTLAEETALFGEIRRAVVEGRSSEALAAVRRHEREFPNGVFRLERIVAKARALCDLGRKKQAKAVRDGFLRRHPRSHLVTRMRDVCP